MDEIFGKKSNSTFSNFHTQNEDFINLKEIAGDPQSMAVLTKNPISGHVTRNPLSGQNLISRKILQKCQPQYHEHQRIYLHLILSSNHLTARKSSQN